MGPTVSRRSFLGSVAGGLALTALNRRIVAQQTPNDQVVMGLIGVGGMGTNRLRDFIKHPDVRIASDLRRRPHARRSRRGGSREGGRLTTSPRPTAISVAC